MSEKNRPGRNVLHPLSEIIGLPVIGASGRGIKPQTPNRETAAIYAFVNQTQN